MPLISVILPVKDGSATLLPAVTSTLRSLPNDAELVILDDGSSDDPVGSLSAVVDRRVRIIRNETSVGVGAGLRQLMEGTDSRFVARMDADDITLPGRFAVQMRSLSEGADFTFSSIVSFSEAPRRVRLGLPLPITAEAMPLHFLVHNPLCHPAMAARRDAINKAGGYRDAVAEDHDLWLRALTARLRLTRTPRPLLAYRHHANQVSGQQEYLARALSDGHLRGAYIDFAESQFGVEATWLDALWSGESNTLRVTRDLAILKSLIDKRSRSLGELQRLVLSRTVRLLAERG